MCMCCVLKRIRFRCIIICICAILRRFGRLYLAMWTYGRPEAPYESPRDTRRWQSWSIVWTRMAVQPYGESRFFVSSDGQRNLFCCELPSSQLSSFIEAENSIPSKSSAYTQPQVWLVPKYKDVYISILIFEKGNVHFELSISLRAKCRYNSGVDFKLHASRSAGVNRCSLHRADQHLQFRTSWND